MAEATLVTQEEMALRRRARRRLVGAVAIALTAFVAVPMLFDSEPKPLGPEVDLRIPAKDSPFEPGTAAGAQNAPAPAASEPAAQTAEPTTTPSSSASPAGATQPAPRPVIETAPVSPAVQDKAAPAQPARPSADKAEPKPVAAVKPKAEPQPEAKPGAKPKTDVKPEAKAKPEGVPARPDPAFASKGFYLQLGAFGSETNARQLLEKAQAAGFKVGLTGTNGQYRVRVGPVPEHAKALEMQARLKAKGFSPVLLGP